MSQRHIGAVIGFGWAALSAVFIVEAIALGAQFNLDVGTLQSCGSSCSAGCSRDGQTIGDPTAQTGSCAPTSTTFDWLAADGTSAVTFLYIGSGGTMQLQHSVDGGVTWTNVGSSVNSFPSEQTIIPPIGRYRTAATACSGCTYTTKWHYVLLR